MPRGKDYNVMIAPNVYQTVWCSCEMIHAGCLAVQVEISHLLPGRGREDPTCRAFRFQNKDNIFGIRLQKL